jgi:hypothetical protein
VLLLLLFPFEELPLEELPFEALLFSLVVLPGKFRGIFFFKKKIPKFSSEV